MFQLVSDAAHRYDSRGMVGILLQFLSQPTNVNVHYLGFARESRSPHAAEKLIHGKDVPGFEGEDAQEVEFARR